MRLTYRLAWVLIRTFGWTLFGFKIRGTKKIPMQGRIIFAANHRSNLDPPILGASLPRETYYMAKAQLFEKPILGRLVKHYNSIPVKRSGQDLEALRATARVLESENGVIMFPEGTRSFTENFLPVTAGVGFLAAQTDSPVFPVYIGGTPVNFKRIFIRKPIKVIVGDPLRFSELFTDPGQNKREAYLAFSQKIMDEIAALKAAEQSM
ncbi:MAG: lysophospholipid acyltransferase family protein [bacterium]|nr:lysophospholipid acyltransferase family protein [bacterium]